MIPMDWLKVKEFSTKKVLALAKQSKSVMEFLPEPEWIVRPLTRDYILLHLSTIHPDWS